MDGETREIPVFDVDLDEDPLLRWRSIAAARELGDTKSQTFDGRFGEPTLFKRKNHINSMF